MIKLFMSLMIFLFGIYISGHCGAIMHFNGSFHVKIGMMFQRIHDNLTLRNFFVFIEIRLTDLRRTFRYYIFDDMRGFIMKMKYCNMQSGALFRQI